MIDIQSETLVSLGDAAKNLLPHRNGKSVHIASLYRWISEGRRARSGRRVRLEAVRVGAVSYTSPEALARFIGRLSETEVDDAPTPSTPRERRHAVAAADRALDHAGIV